jgi:hypothetical protein
MCDWPYRWAIQWRSENKLDGYTEHFKWNWRDPDRVTPALFRTRQEARNYINKYYSYIRTRTDLKAEPHGWKCPRPIKVKVILQDQGE